MNKVIYAYRVWRIDFGDLTYRLSLNEYVSKSWIKWRFKVPDTAKITPILDKRMKNGGRKML